MENTASILLSIKKLLGIMPDYEHFDPDIIIHINSAFSVLNQLDVGPEEGFKINDAGECWCQFTDDLPILEMVKDYVYLSVKLIFDPPQTAAAVESFKNMLKEYEWRLNVAVDPKPTD